MSSEGLLKNGKKKVVIVGGGAAGMVNALRAPKHRHHRLTLPLVLRCDPSPTSR